MPSNTSLLKALFERKSVRAYTDEPVTPEQKETILTAAMRAPTAGNMMLYSILEVEDQALKDRLAVTCDNQPFIARAPYVLLFVADYQRWYDYYLACGVEALCQSRGIEMRTPLEGDLLLACCDTLIAAQTAVVAAEALGIGSCYIGDILEHYETHREMFGLPQYALPVALVCFGHPTKGQRDRRQPERFESRYVVHKDRYQRLDTTGLHEMMCSRNEKLLASGAVPEGVENLGQFTYLRKFGADFSVEMSRSVRAMVRSWAARQEPETQA